MQGSPILYLKGMRAIISNFLASTIRGSFQEVINGLASSVRLFSEAGVNIEGNMVEAGKLERVHRSKLAPSHRFQL